MFEQYYGYGLITDLTYLLYVITLNQKNGCEYVHNGLNKYLAFSYTKVK